MLSRIGGGPEGDSPPSGHKAQVNPVSKMKPNRSHSQCRPATVASPKRDSASAGYLSLSEVSQFALLADYRVSGGGLEGGFSPLQSQGSGQARFQDET